MLTKIIFVVLKEFFKTGSGNAYEFELSFFGGAGGLAGFSDILFAGTGGLIHLIAGAGLGIDVAFGEDNGKIVNYDSGLVGEKLAVSAVGRNDFGIGPIGPIGRIGHIGPILAQTDGVEVGDGGQAGIEVCQDENLFARGIGGGEVGFHGAVVDNCLVLAVVFGNDDLLVGRFEKMGRIGEPGVA